MCDKPQKLFWITLNTAIDMVYVQKIITDYELAEVVVPFNQESTHCGLVTKYDDKVLGQHKLR